MLKLTKEEERSTFEFCFRACEPPQVSLLSALFPKKPQKRKSEKARLSPPSAFFVAVLIMEEASSSASRGRRFIGPTVTVGFDGVPANARRWSKKDGVRRRRMRVSKECVRTALNR